MRLCLGAMLALLWAYPQSSEACSCIWAQRDNRFFPPSGELPAEAKGVVWWGGPADFSVIDASTRKIYPVKVTPYRDVEKRGDLFLVTPSIPMLPGRSYQFRAKLRSKITPGAIVLAGVKLSSVRFRRLRPRLRISKAPPPGHRHFRHWNHHLPSVPRGASCAAKVRGFQYFLRMELPKALRQVLFFRLLVNGKPHPYLARSLCASRKPGEGYVGRGEVRFAATCDALHKAHLKPGLYGKGTYSLKMQAFLPGDPRPLSDPSQLEISCGAFWESFRGPLGRRAHVLYGLLFLAAAVVGLLSWVSWQKKKP